MTDQEIVNISKGIYTSWDFIYPYLLLLKNLIVQFWWLPLPILLYRPLKFLFILFMETKWNLGPDLAPIVLEVKIPKHITRPLKAMENVFNGFWPSYDPPKDWRATYYEGKTIVSASFEIAGTAGKPHFYIRIPKQNRKLLESVFYAQYPDIELVEVPDYTQSVPQDLPNNDWDLWGCDFMPLKEDVYPLKTFEDFFETNPDTKEEEKKIDPLASLLEEIAKMQKDEHIWIQMTVMPISVKEDNYVKRGKDEIDKLLKRVKAKKGRTEPYPMFLEAVYMLIFGRQIGVPETKAEEDGMPWEMRLTPGERDVIAAIEKKISKICYVSRIRFIYLAKKTAFFGGAKAFGPSFFTQFSTLNLNGLKPWTTTITKVQAPDIFRKRRLYGRKRSLFYRYVNRMSAFDPFPGGNFLLSTEEMATIYHFPGIEIAPTLSLKRIETKRAAPPASLPTD